MVWWALGWQGGGVHFGEEVLVAQSSAKNSASKSLFHSNFNSIFTNVLETFTHFDTSTIFFLAILIQLGIAVGNIKCTEKKNHDFQIHFGEIWINRYNFGK